MKIREEFVVLDSYVIREKGQRYSKIEVGQQFMKGYNHK